MKVTVHHRPLPPPDTRVGLIDNRVSEDNWTPDGVQAYLDGKYGSLKPPRKPQWVNRRGNNGQA